MSFVPTEIDPLPIDVESYEIEHPTVRCKRILEEKQGEIQHIFQRTINNALVNGAFENSNFSLGDAQHTIQEHLKSTIQELIDMPIDVRTVIHHEYGIESFARGIRVGMEVRWYHQSMLSFTMVLPPRMIEDAAMVRRRQREYDWRSPDFREPPPLHEFELRLNRNGERYVHRNENYEEYEDTHDQWENRLGMNDTIPEPPTNRTAPATEQEQEPEVEPIEVRLPDDLFNIG